MYLRGSMNGWATSTAFEYVKEGVYQVSAYLQLGEYEFKFASDDWATVNLGFGSVTDNSGLLQDAGGNFKLTLSEAGLWHFVLNASDTAHPSLSLSQTDYACYQDDAPVCNLRIYQVMVESLLMATAVQTTASAMAVRITKATYRASLIASITSPA